MIPVSEWLFAAFKEKLKQGTSTLQAINREFADDLHTLDKRDLEVGAPPLSLMTQK
jgi:hypothetical protein